MNNGTNKRWTTRVGVVAALAVAGVLGTCLPANAIGSSPAAQHLASASATAPAAATRSEAAALIPQSASASAISGRPAGADNGVQSWSTILRLAKEALRKVPALWNNTVAGAKKGYSSFKNNVWPAIKFTVQVVSASITAWDIWNMFR